MLGISAIGWKDEEEEQILSANAGAFNVLEIVPARIFAQNKDYADIAKEYRESYGLWAYSAQALFFQSNVQSFANQQLADHFLVLSQHSLLFPVQRIFLLLED